ncbi:BlaI/MecI/CopY family transcriptional regulator [Duganella sp. FT27W]|uniref:BlaI/MecI/CopY family transcriptional regulator n=1 Tax=Duganella sp. FT27W TaxID=2654636 RepID=UPI00128B58B3|nr:BlaI/MecI/CopY family transcriptional regulator [Duganella sp. FT27W]MPQ56427.1 BlaI/MecI/CopY family transcriptional regulator [Duganella sp. FT27W]
MSNPIPSVSELTLLKALWKQQPLSAREIHDAAADELAWSFSSTRKTLDRMLDKDMIAVHVMHGVNVYSARLDKVGTLAAFAHDFGRRVMELDAPLPVAMFTGSKLVDQQELSRIEQMLNDWPDDEAEQP